MDAQATPGPVEVEVVENPLTLVDVAMGAAAEQQIRELLAGEDMARVEVRLRLCRLDDAATVFICKLDYAGDGERGPWRWWSPLLETPEGLRESLQEALAVRRRRLELAPTGVLERFKRGRPRRVAAGALARA